MHKRKKAELGLSFLYPTNNQAYLLVIKIHDSLTGFLYIIRLSVNIDEVNRFLFNFLVIFFRSNGPHKPNLGCHSNLSHKFLIRTNDLKCRGVITDKRTSL